jgi:hypothetical protein
MAKLLARHKRSLTDRMLDELDFLLTESHEIVAEAKASRSLPARVAAIAQIGRNVDSMNRIRASISPQQQGIVKLIVEYERAAIKNPLPYVVERPPEPEPARVVSAELVHRATPDPPRPPRPPAPALPPAATTQAEAPKKSGMPEGWDRWLSGGKKL